MAEQYKKALTFIDKLKTDNPILKKKNEGIQYTIIDGPLQVLNMVYPTEALEGDSKITAASIEKMYGSDGLMRLMKRGKSKKDYQYRDTTLNQFGDIFRRKN